MSRPYVYERQSEYWTSRQVEEFFLDVGFELVAFPLTAYNEQQVPADFLFFDKGRTKLFAFQYKALYGNGRDHWPINQEQHDLLAHFSWIYYCLSELRYLRDSRAALHLSRIKTSNFEYQPRLYVTGADRIRGYVRWSTFYQNLEKCHSGLLVRSDTEMRNALTIGSNVVLPYELERLVIDAFVLDLASRRAVHFSPYLSQPTEQSPE